MQAPATDALWALVLAGGDGTRLQALTRLIAGAPIPKQYCRIVGDRSLLETTLGRIAPLVPPERTLAIVNRGHLPLARPQLAAIPAANLLVQPRNRDTGPGLVVSLLALARRDRAATVAVLPSDHHIRDEAAFRRHVVRMALLVAAHPERIALLGARPDRPETGYGYIAPGHRLVGPGEAFRVVAFHEKPAPALAARIIRRGGLWNSFVMVGRVARMLELVGELRPGDVADLEGTPAEPDALAATYERLAPWNFSRDFLARVPEHLMVARADDLGWSDWGTPEAIERTLAALRVAPPWRAPLTATA
ncbi:MAG TPA: sugar phosphate nucleotidyltransferase [Candidatus Limnocylindria bacterium]|nr:sugar phosphate nucleotidyltransferase [Candidatus Limnocylindria bacterium]